MTEACVPICSGACGAVVQWHVTAAEHGWHQRQGAHAFTVMHKPAVIKQALGCQQSQPARALQGCPCTAGCQTASRLQPCSQQCKARRAELLLADVASSTLPRALSAAPCMAGN